MITTGLITRSLVNFAIILVSTIVFGWVGLAIGILIAFGVSWLFGQQITIDHSEPFFGETQPASIWDVHFFEMFGYLCKIDGVVSRDEIRGVEVVFDHLGFSGDERVEAISRFNRGKRADFDFQAALDEIRQLRLDVHTAANLIHLMNIVVANADGSGLVVEERDLLFQIGNAFGLNDAVISEVLLLGSTNARQQQSRSIPRQSPQQALEIAYSTLGIDPSSSDKEIARSYRKLRGKHHPDRLPKGASEADHAAAEKRFNEIQRAWDIVRVHHGM